VIFSKLVAIANSAWYWLALVLVGLGMEGVALYFQYGLDYGPCVLCIHTRIWTAGFILTALVALWARRFWATRVLVHLLNTLMMAGILERAWMLFGTERGIVFGSCTMNLGLPPWLALDTWIPSIFGVLEPCGYTPELLFGVTTAEALLAFGAVMCPFSAVLVIVTILSRWLRAS